MTFFYMPYDERSPTRSLAGSRPDRSADEGGMIGGTASNDRAIGDPWLLRSIVDFVALSMADKPFGDLLGRYLALVRPVGFTDVALIDVSRVDETNPAAGLCFTTFPAETVTRFAKSPRWLDDPIWKATMTAERTFRWSEIETGTRGGTADANLFYRTEGLEDGLTIPVSIPHMKRGAVFLGTDRLLDLDETIEEMLKVASRVLATRAPRPEDRWNVAHRLTGRERQVLALTAVGKSAREIGRDLDMSEKTVARHLLNIRGKLGAANTVQAVVIALRQEQIHL